MILIKQMMSAVLRPLVSLIPRGRHRIFRIFGMGGRDDPDWSACSRPIRMLWDRELQAWIRCDLREWGGRWYYYHQQYYDRILPLLLRSYLLQGDTFMDIGANVGIHTLLAARLVGETGTVMAVEQHPITCSWLRAHLAINEFPRVQVFQVGLGAGSGTACLTMKDNHSGTASMRGDMENDTSLSNTVLVPVECGDTIFLSQITTGNIFMKIDVEGLEFAVIMGFRGFLETRKPKWVYVEVTPAWLVQRGESATTLIGWMQEFGYQTEVATLYYKDFLFPRIAVHPFHGVPSKQQDLLFVRIH